MTTSRVVQKNIQAKDVIGRDKNTFIEAKASAMAKLISDYELKSGTDEDFAETFPALLHYMSGLNDTPLRGLEEKLSAAGRKNQLVEARQLKQDVAMLLHKHSTSASAQKICIYVLGEILNRFKVYVFPLIKSGTEKETVDIAIFEEVVTPVLEGLENNILLLFHKEIWGMIFYLTGNCHIEWSEHC